MDERRGLLYLGQTLMMKTTLYCCAFTIMFEAGRILVTLIFYGI